EDKYPDRIKFKAILQEADVKGGNGVLYPKDVLIDGLNQIHHKMKNRTWFGEYGHPNIIITDDPEQKLNNQKRVRKIDPIRISHIITDYWWEGIELWGLIETLPFGYGLHMTQMVGMNIPINFSLMASGDSTVDKINRIVVAKKIKKMVTYDFVIEASFQNAHFKELSESIYFSPNNKIFQEGLDESKISFIELAEDIINRK
ncbi:MAG: S80 family phage morphogenetic serine protease, partial [Nanoarchaeota archaeon]